MHIDSVAGGPTPPHCEVKAQQLPIVWHHAALLQRNQLARLWSTSIGQKLRAQGSQKVYFVAAKRRKRRLLVQCGVRPPSSSLLLQLNECRQSELDRSELEPRRNLRSQNLPFSPPALNLLPFDWLWLRQEEERQNLSADVKISDQRQLTSENWLNLLTSTQGGDCAFLNIWKW